VGVVVPAGFLHGHMRAGAVHKLTESENRINPVAAAISVRRTVSYKRTGSGILIPDEKPKPPFKCSYELDQRPDKDLANLFQRMYRAVQSMLGAQVKFTLKPRQGIEREVFPDPVQAWTIYIASLLHGVSDAALTLVLHNLGREARILERQAFEYVTKAMYFQRHPRAAKREMEAEVFRDRHLLNQLGYDKRSKRYRHINGLCVALAKKRPALAEYARRTMRNPPPSVPDTLGPKRKQGMARRAMTMYALHYRTASQTLHATVLGMREVITERGVSFDGRLANPNMTLLFMARYVLAFLKILDQVFALDKADEVQAFEAELKLTEQRLFSAIGAYKGP
jgi:Family of unknown function (DUF5677)